MPAQINQTQVNNNIFSNLGRMFAKRNVPEAYSLTKAAGTADPESPSGQIDQVSLSPFAPRPLPARLFEEALDSGRLMGQGKKLPDGLQKRIREDRIFAAVSALAAIGETGEETGMTRAWPAGLPVPTPEEMEMARRRLTQRFWQLDQAEAPAAAQQQRVELLNRIGQRNFAASEAREDIPPIISAPA
ncbi:MAG: hypothetical protein FWG74_07195 [Planctomycetes bacterium]|nr:hypothetical protein [Planctomycetota bacterium]